jgi:hypothetical protein
MGRILKDKATVPLFLAQTLIQSLRDVGYNHTTSALCEHVDNAVQEDATEIRAFFRQTGKGENKRTDVAIYDNGRGMSPTVLKVATAFGGSMSYGNRDGIARFGTGMKTAALSMIACIMPSPRLWLTMPSRRCRASTGARSERKGCAFT